MSSASSSTGHGKAGATHKALTQAAIFEHARRAGEKARTSGVEKFWKVEKPSQPLALSGARKFVAKHPMYESAQPRSANNFIYYPDFRVAGTIQEIGNALYGAGITTMPVGALNAMTRGAFGDRAGQVQVTADNLYNNSIDPRNPQHEAFILSITPARGAGGSVARAKGPSMPIAQWAAIAGAIQKTTATKGEGKTKAKGKGGGGGGTKDPEANRANRVRDFDAAMTVAVGGGMPAKVIDVTAFDAKSNTKARNKDAPKPSATGVMRSKARRLTINFNGRPVLLPVISQDHADENLRAYVNNVVARSQQYGGAAPAILEALGSAQRGVTMPVGAFSAAPAAMQFPTFAAASSSASPRGGQASPAPLFSQTVAPVRNSPIGGFPQQAQIPLMPTMQQTQGFGTAQGLGAMQALPTYR